MYHSWVTWFHLKESLWTQQGERGLGLEAANDCVRGAVFPWVGRLLSKVHSKLLQDRKASYGVVEERKQVCLE
jgi:hypothetical protein